MAAPKRRMALNLFLEWANYHHGGWRLPDTPSDPSEAFRTQLVIAQKAEAAKMDAIFKADIPRVEKWKHPMGHQLEPFVMLGAIAAGTNEIGLIGTASTTLMEPYNLARLVATLDHISGGRAGWNIVTSRVGGENFGKETLEHDERYARAYEYLDVVTALWDSWSDNAVVNDKSSGTWSDSSKIRPIDFRGQHYSVAGPLNISRSPQGWPVLVQAGASDTGVAFAARYAEMVFTVQAELGRAQDFYRKVKDATVKAGRDPEKVRLMPGIQPILGDTEAEAKKLADHLAEMIDLEDAMGFLTSTISGVRFDDLDPNKPIPLDRLPAPEEVQGERGRYAQFRKWTVEGQTLADLARTSAQGRGHLFAVGTAEQVAATMEQWFIERACDGFQIQPPFLMEGIDRVVDELIPILQSRGLAQTEYEGSTFRERLGLERPPSRW
jgi:FMN-dependent oxidoreductase (nitrilotriacetate monooxygenase family)